MKKLAVNLKSIVKSDHGSGFRFRIIPSNMRFSFIMRLKQFQIIFFIALFLMHAAAFTVFAQSNDIRSDTIRIPQSGESQPYTHQILFAQQTQPAKGGLRDMPKDITLPTTGVESGTLDISSSPDRDNIMTVLKDIAIRTRRLADLTVDKADDKLAPIKTAGDVASHGGAGEVMDQVATYWENLSKGLDAGGHPIPRNELRQMVEGADKLKQLQQYRDALAAQADKLNRIGSAISIIDSGSKIAGALWEGEGTIAAITLADEVCKVGAISFGAAFGSPWGPGGAIVGAFTAEEFWRKFGSPKFEQRAQLVKNLEIWNKTAGDIVRRKIGSLPEFDAYMEGRISEADFRTKIRDYAEKNNKDRAKKKRKHEREIELLRKQALTEPELKTLIDAWENGKLHQSQKPLLLEALRRAIRAEKGPAAKAGDEIECDINEPEPPIPNNNADSLIQTDKNALNACLCRCTISPTSGVGATYDPKAWKNASPSCDDARNGPCVGFGLGCWRRHMESEGKCFDQCIAAAKAKPQEVKAEIYQTKFKAYNDFLGEARSIMEEYLAYKAGLYQKKSDRGGHGINRDFILLAGNFPDDASLGRILFAAASTGSAPTPTPYAEMVREKNRRGDPDRALGLVRAAEAVMPDRMASGETTNILAEFAIIMSKASLNIVTELEFDEGLYLLHKAAEFYTVGKSNPLGENIRRLTGNFEKWKKDWQILKSEIPGCLALIKDKSVCQCDRLYNEKITPAANSLTIYEFASSEKWSISTANGTPRAIAEKDKIYNELKDKLSRAKNECANNPAMNTKEMKDLTDYEARKFLEKSPYINQEDLKKNSAPVICDTRAVKNAEKLLSAPGLCDCQQEKIKGILDTAKKDERPLAIEFGADKKELAVGERVMINLSIKGGLPPFSADMIGDYSYNMRSEARGFNINYQAEKAGTNNFYVTVVDSCGDSGSKKASIYVKPAQSSKPLPPTTKETTKTSSATQIPNSIKKQPPVYDPTRDPNISSSGSKNVDIAQVDKLGNEFQGAQTGVKQNDPKVDNNQAPVAQSDAYTGSNKKPEDNSADIPPYPPFQPDDNKTSGNTWTDGVKTKDSGYKDSGSNSSSSNTNSSNSSPSAKCDPSQKQAAYNEGNKCGQKAKQNKNKITSDCQPIPQTYMNKDNKRGWGSCLYSGFDEGYRAGLGTTTTNSNSSSSTPVVLAELKNNSSENVHIFAEGQDNFGPQNKLTPGEKPKKVSVKVPKDGGFVKFIAGRNGQKLADCKWEYTPASSSRVPVVTFDDKNPYNKLGCTTGLR